MKIMQILNGICHWDATSIHPTLADTVGRYAPDIVFVEAPDYVFIGWGYDPEKTGDERFIKPTAPDGWCYDDATGTFYIYNIDEAKATRISQSKIDLAAYLESHPLQWTDGEYYSITAEKQTQLTSKIMAATMAQTLSADYHLTWNSTGEVCKAWTLQDLSALAFAIDARVTALVTYQQTKEVAIRNAATREELNAIEVNYDEVG